LPQYDHAHVLGRRELQRPQGPGRKDAGARRQPLAQKGQQGLPRGLGEKRPHQRHPARSHGQSSGSAPGSWVGDFSIIMTMNYGKNTVKS